MNLFKLLYHSLRRKYVEAHNTTLQEQFNQSVKKHNSYVMEYSSADKTRKAEIEQIWRDEEAKRENLKKQFK